MLQGSQRKKKEKKRKALKRSDWQMHWMWGVRAEVEGGEPQLSRSCGSSGVEHQSANEDDVTEVARTSGGSTGVSFSPSPNIHPSTCLAKQTHP